jgi:hypothetical protein
MRCSRAVPSCVIIVDRVDVDLWSGFVSRMRTKMRECEVLAYKFIGYGIHFSNVLSNIKKRGLTGSLNLCLQMPGIKIS